jgi:hypothetical protein
MAYLPTPYTNAWNYPNPMAQSYTPQPAQTQGLQWVDGEVGAKAYQMPAGWPANTPIALWDTNDTIIYLKSINQMGMPNPLQKAHYTLEEHRGTGPAMSNTSGDDAPVMTDYVKKDDLERMKQDLMDTIGQMQTSGTGVRKTTAKGAD